MADLHFATATEAIYAYRDGVISRAEVRKLFGLEEDEYDRVEAAKAAATDPKSRRRSNAA